MDTVGGAPLLSKQAANDYVSYFNTHRERLGSLPLSWVMKAQDIVGSSSGTQVAKITSFAESAADKWLRIESSKKSSPSPPIVMKELMKLTGLESVKREFIKEYEKVVIAVKQGVQLQGSSYNLRCDGNPGTGIDLYNLIIILLLRCHLI